MSDTRLGNHSRIGMVPTALLMLFLGALSAGTATAGQWAELALPESPGGAMVHDAVRGRLLLFGGRDSGREPTVGGLTWRSGPPTAREG